jgi:hypothetical protein
MSLEDERNRFAEENAALKAQVEEAREQLWLEKQCNHALDLLAAEARCDDLRAQLDTLTRERDEAHNAEWRKQYALTCLYVEHTCRLEQALESLVDAVNVEFQGGLKDIGGKTGPALIVAVDALADVNKGGPVSDRLQELRAQVNELITLRQQVEQARVALRDAVYSFTESGHPGEACLSSGWVPVDTVRGWRAALAKLPPAKDAP